MPKLSANAWADYYVTLDPEAGKLSRYDRRSERNVALEDDSSTDRQRAERLIAQGYIRDGAPWDAAVAVCTEPRGGRGDCVLPRPIGLARTVDTPFGRVWSENQDNCNYVIVISQGRAR